MTYENVKAQAQANANYFKTDYCVFSDASGNWRQCEWVKRPTNKIGNERIKPEQPKLKLLGIEECNFKPGSIII